MADEKLPESTPDAVKPASEQASEQASDQSVAPVQSGPNCAHMSEPDAQEATLDQLLQDLLDDTDGAALYNLLSVC